MLRSSLSILRSAERRGRERGWNEIEALLIEVEEGIEKRRHGLRSAKGD